MAHPMKVVEESILIVLDATGNLMLQVLEAFSKPESRSTHVHPVLILTAMQPSEQIRLCNCEGFTVTSHLENS